jgi:D-alanyl-D-alanine dipeptidase
MSAKVLPKDFVYLDEFCPEIMQDMKYATTDNFTNSIVNGYKAGRAILTIDAAEALKQAQEELNQDNYVFLVLDAYRPARAVEAFVQWKDIPDNPVIKEKYYPTFQKADLFTKGFIAPGKSSHSRGSTVDLTIFDKTTNKALDMGTPFDFFGPESNTDNMSISTFAMNNRKLLVGIMAKYGFKNLPSEWWHYTLDHEPYKDTYFDFEIV